jgi:GTP cyclohydrolase I
MSIGAMTIDAADTGRPELRLVRGGSNIDLDAAERAVADLLAALGQDPGDEHMRETPRRVAAAYAELLTPREFSLTTFPNHERYGTNWSWHATSRSTRSVNTTCCRSRGLPTSVTCPASASSGCPSWHESSSSSPVACKPRNG